MLPSTDHAAGHKQRGDPVPLQLVSYLITGAHPAQGKKVVSFVHQSLLTLSVIAILRMEIMRIFYKRVC